MAIDSSGITVVIVNWNGGEFIAEVLTALARQTVSPAHVVVMDNASTDGSPEIIAGQFPEVTLRQLDKNLGFAAANNLAIEEEVKTPWVALLNPDAVPAHNWIEALVKGVEQYPGYWAYGCRMRCYHNPTILDGTGDCYHPSGLAWRRDHGVPEKEGHLSPGEIFSPCAAAALYRCDKFRAIGGFDENFFCYFEDVDLGFRLRLAGGACFYLPAAIVYHVGSASTSRKSDFSVYYGYRNLIGCYWKNMPVQLLVLYLPFHCAVNVALLWRAWWRGQWVIALSAQKDAIKSLPKLWKKRQPMSQSARLPFTKAADLLAAWRARAA